MRDLRILQLAVAVGGCVPVLAGGAGVLLGPALVGGLPGEAAGDSHFRYLSGLLLGIGLGFWSTIPALPRRAVRFRLLTAIVVLGGLSRLLAVPLQGWPGGPMGVALVMELVVTPLLCLWQARIASAQRTRNATSPA
ncbi:DUF4345 domain-containing protein [Falsiroseomonas sp. HC035]|uniref:DUF4345 domain-containing protein n=1 Tax=Falsiroseomonas sp. HC035 TaxID=3390999 RepID=UPI003D322682